MKPIRVLIGLSEVAGHYRGLKLGFERLGIPCTFINLSEHPFAFDADDDVWPVRFVQKTDTRRRKSSGLSWWGLALVQGVLQSVLFFRLLPRHDVFIYCANRNFMAFADLLILRLCGKKIIYQMHGSDSRAPYFDGSYNGGDLLSDKSLLRLTRFKKLIVRIIERFAHVVVNIPPQAHLCEKPFINWLHVGLSCFPPDLQETPPPACQASGPIRIMHGPSDPGAKGTPLIREAVERLKARGVEVTFVELVGVPNSKVIEEIKKADLIIDQMYADYAMPGLATESAWYGKPVLICGYAVDDWQNWMQSGDLPPTCFIHPDELDDALYEVRDGSGEAPGSRHCDV